MIVKQYAAQFTQLSKFTPLMVISKSHEAQKVLKGFRVDIYNQVAMLRPSLYIEVFEYAHLVEDLILVQQQCITRIHTQLQQHRQQ